MKTLTLRTCLAGLLVLIAKLAFSHEALRDSGISPTASTYHIFPQFADGRVGETIYKTTLMISNPNRAAGSNCILNLRGVTLEGFAITYDLGAGGWAVDQSIGGSSFQAGYATLSCSAVVEAQLLYSIYSTSGAKISEATVFSSPASNRLALIADEREGARLGIAIANDSDNDVTYTVAVTNATATGTITVPARSSRAGFVSELLPGAPANNLNVVTITASGNATASVIGFRFTGLAITTVPASLSGTDDPIGSTYHIFPQFADGKFPDGGSYRSTRLLLNRSSATPASCTTLLWGMTSGGQDSFEDTLSPGQAIAETTAGLQAFQSGYASVQCSTPVDALMLYSAYTASGQKISETAVFPSAPAGAVQVLTDPRDGARVGIALTNDTDSVQTYTVLVYNASNALVGTSLQELPPRTSTARFVDEMVRVFGNNYGSVIVTGTVPVSVTGLRYTGLAFTAIPPTILSANASPLSVTRAFTANTAGIENTSFHQGETVRLSITVNNAGSSTLVVNANHRVTGPSTGAVYSRTAPILGIPQGTTGSSVDFEILSTHDAGVYTTPGKTLRRRTMQ